MRTIKCTVLIIFLTLGVVGCGGEKEGPDAATQMRKNKLVRIATDAVNLPFEFGSGTGVQGFDVDIGNEIGTDLGYEVKWVKIPFERLFEILKNGEAEMVISAISITQERKKEFAFSEPYYDSGNTIAHRKDKMEIKDLASLSGRKLGVQSSSTGSKFLETQKTATNITVVKFPTLDDALGALNRTEIDAVIGDEPILTYSIYKSFPNLITIGTRLTEEEYGVVVRRSEKELLAKVNESLQRLKKSGELDALRKKWFQDVMEQARKEREEATRQQALKDSPKEITFTFIKLSGTFNMERLDGFQLNLVGDQTFQSNPILTTGNRGSCKLNGVPPGEYRLSMPIFKLNTSIKIPNLPSRTVAFDMNISSGGLQIVQK